MADTVKKIQDYDNSRFGKYDENTGGGHPFKAGDSNTRTTKENGKLRQSNNDTMQPRTNDGKFTYKSANGHAIKSEKSRGKTVNPLLTGGVNGVYIEDVEKQFKEKSGEYFDKYKDTWYVGGGEMIGTDFKTHISQKACWEVAHEKYDEEKGELGGESKNWEYNKRGVKSKDEKAAIQKAQVSGKSEAVIDKSTGAIKNAPNKSANYMTDNPEHKDLFEKKEKPKFVKKTTPTKPAEVTPSPVTPSMPTPQPQAPTANASASVGGGSGNFVKKNSTDDYKKKLSQVIPAEELDEYDDDEIEEIYKQMFSKGA